MKKQIVLGCVLGLVLFCHPDFANAQGMAVNTTGVAATSSAMLDVSSTTQGMLVPRMTSAQRTAITSPATGLLVYQTDGTTGFYYFNGTAWTAVSGGGGSPTGAAGGDLTGTYPNPTVANSSVTSAKILDGTITNSDVSTSAAIAYSKLNLAGSVSTSDMNATGTASSGTFLRGDGTWATPAGGTPSGAAGGDLTGTYPNPTIAAGAITSTSILDGTIITADIANTAITNLKLANSAVSTSKLADGAVTTLKIDAIGATTGQVMTYDGTGVVWATPSGGGGSPTGAAGGDLTGTYPNPTIANSAITNLKLANSSVSTSKIADGAVTTLKIDAIGATSGQVMTYNGTSVAWTTPSGGSSGGSGAAPTSIPVCYAGHTGAAAWNSPTSSGQQLTLNALVCTVLPASLKPSMTIYSYSGASTTWSLYTVTPSSSSATWSLGSSVISCTTGAAAGSTCSVTAPSNSPAGTILVITSGTGQAPGGGGFLAVFSAQ